MKFDSASIFRVQWRNGLSSSTFNDLDVAIRYAQKHEPAVVHQWNGARWVWCSGSRESTEAVVAKKESKEDSLMASAHETLIKLGSCTAAEAAEELKVTEKRARYLFLDLLNRGLATREKVVVPHRWGGKWAFRYSVKREEATQCQ